MITFEFVSPLVLTWAAVHIIPRHNWRGRAFALAACLVWGAYR